MKLNKSVKALLCVTLALVCVLALAACFEKHEHTYSQAWSSDATNHWHAATCEHTTLKDSQAAHTFNSGVITKESTETVQGEKKYTCTVCGYSKTEKLPLAEHTHVFDQQLAEEQYLKSAATCTEKAVYFVSCKCGEKGAETFESGDALGHNFGTEWISDGDGHWHKCERCEQTSDYAAHTAEIDSAVAASCTEDGLTEGSHCSICKYVIAEQQTVKASGHDYTGKEPSAFTWSADLSSASATINCANCGKTESLGATVTVTWNPEVTCATAGVKTCVAVIVVNGKSYTETKENIQVAALGHQMVSHAKVEASCTKDGNEAYWSCSRCNKNFEDEEGNTEIADISAKTIAALGHNYPDLTDDNFTWTSDNTAKVTLTCSRCNVSESKAAEVTFATDSATCEKAGTVTYTATYTLNEKSHSVTKVVEGAALGHDYSGESAVVWTWNTDYSSVTAKFTCQRENCTHTYEQTATSASGIQSQVVTAASCTEEGKQGYTATVTADDGKSYSDYVEVVVAALGHKAASAWTSDDAQHWHVCENGCSEKLNVADHTFGDWTTDGDSQHKHSCTVCEYEAKASHSWNNGEVTTAAACGADGVKTFTCNDCSAQKTEAITDRPAHTWEEKIDVEATCTTTGSKHSECSVCGEKTESETIPITHDYQIDQELSDYSECEGGTISYLCSKCYNSYDENVTGKGHNYVEGVCSVCSENEPTNVFTVSSTSGSKGDTVTVTIDLGGVVKTAGFKIRLTYDSDKLNLRKYTDGGLNTTYNTNTAGTVIIVVTKSTNIVAGTNIATLTFLIKTDTAGEVALNLTCEDLSCTWKDTSIHKPSYSCVSGGITVTAE